MKTEINEPKEGDYFSIKQNGEDWPIVICDEEIIQTFFSHVPKPESVRKADGTWSRDYKAGGISVSDRRFPAINLGTLILLWAPLKALEPIDIDMGRVIQSSTMSPLLAKAWSQYTNQYKGDKILEWKFLDHWKTQLRAQRLNKTATRSTEKEKLPAGRMHGSLKRKDMPEFKYPSGYRHEDMDDEESDDLFLAQGMSGGPKIKRESINSSSSEEIDALYSDADPPYRTSSQSSKRNKLDLSGRFSMRPSTPRLATTSISNSARHGTPMQSTHKTVDVHDPNTIIIYVDNPHKMFKVKRGGLDASPLLSKLLAHHPQNGWYIMSPILSSLDADDFQPVGEYIDRREYHPNILDDGTVHVRLEGDLSADMLRQEVMRCGTVYQIAQMLEMPGLQDLAFRKLRALEPHYQALEILTVIESLFEIGSLEIRQYLTQHVADHYWNLVLAETEKMVEVMSVNEDLAKGVFGLLSGRDDGVKSEDVVKEEGKEEVYAERKEGTKPNDANNEADLEGKEEGFAETNGGTKPNNVNHEVDFDRPNSKGKAALANSAAGNDSNRPNEGLSQAEKDMVRMAIRQADEEKSSQGLSQTEGDMVKMALQQSDDEKTEGDWVQLVRKQSDLFEAF